MSATLSQTLAIDVHSGAIMKRLPAVETLGKGFDFLRVDLYACDEWIRVGELTLYPGGGFDAFEPKEYDLLLGEKWRLGFSVPG